MNLRTFKGLMEKNGNWWKGSFPTWIVAILIAIIGYFIQREMQINLVTREKNQEMILALTVKVESLQVRISVLERTVDENHLLLNEVNKLLRTPGGR